MYRRQMLCKMRKTDILKWSPRAKYMTKFVEALKMRARWLKLDKQRIHGGTWLELISSPLLGRLCRMTMSGGPLTSNS